MTNFAPLTGVCSTRIQAALLCAFAALLPLAGSVLGQPSGTGTDDPPVNRPSSSPIQALTDLPIQAVGPDTYILLDENGEPQPVPGMTYEDFLAAWKELHQEKPANHQRRFTIDRIEVEGQALDDRAELTLRASIQLLSDEATEVPLGLVGAILTGTPRFDAPSENDPSEAGQEGEREAAGDYLYFNPEHGGYIAHFQGRSGERRQVTLQLVVALVRNGTEVTLPINIPRATTSNFNLAIQEPATDLNASSGTLLEKAQSSGGATTVRIAGAFGAVRINWTTEQQSAESIGPVLTSEGSILSSIDGRSVRSEARLTVQSYGGSFDRFRVRLPPGAELLPDSSPENQPPEYRVTLERTDSPDGTQSDASKVALIELSEKQRGPVSIALTTEQPIGPDEHESVVNLGGFEVLGAVRQFGDIALDVAEDWQARWNIGEFVRQVDPSDLDSSLQQSDITASFQYDRQPWSMAVGIMPRQLRMHATPRYALEFLAEEVRLSMRLTYQVFGSRAFEFRVLMNGWELSEDPIESGGLVNQDRVLVTPQGELVLPLSQSSSRRMEITFVTRRKLPSGTERITLPLPVPVADSVGTGDVLIRSDAAVQVLPVLSESVGLTSARPRTDSSANVEMLEPRYRTTLPEAVLVADRVNRAREIATTATTHIEIDPDTASINRLIDYVVQYQSIEQLSFELPPGLPAEEISITLVGDSSTASSTQADREIPLKLAASEEPPSAGTLVGPRLIAVLPQPTIGRFSIRLRYDLARNGRGRELWNLPLVQPVQGAPSREMAVVEAAPSLNFALDTQAGPRAWEVVTDSADAQLAASSVQYISDWAQQSLPLVVRSLRPGDPVDTTIERVWLQTWIAEGMRQDRSAFQLRTSAMDVAIELPPQAAGGDLEILLDGRPVAIESSGTGRIIVPIARAAEDGASDTENAATRHTVELRFRQPIREGLLVRYRLTPPQVVGIASLSELYWQIITPGDEHIVRSPERMASASQWQWLGSFWGRSPLLSQADLESWVGASRGVAPTDEANEYVYSGIAPLSSIEIVTAPRWLIVFAASGASLGLGLAWIYLSFLQRRWLAAGLAIVAAILATVFPVPALLLAQAALLGLLLAILAVVISRFTSRPARWATQPSAGSSIRQTTSRPDSFVISSGAAAASTAPTVPLISPDLE